MDIGKRIVHLRELKGWSQREIALRVKLNVSVMNRIESGERPVKDQELADIARALDTTSDYLLGITDNPNQMNEHTKDEKDIAKRMKEFRRDLTSSDGLNFSGEPMSDDAKESLIDAMEHIFRQTQLINKKFIPNKHRKDDN